MRIEKEIEGEKDREILLSCKTFDVLLLHAITSFHPSTHKLKVQTCDDNYDAHHGSCGELKWSGVDDDNDEDDDDDDHITKL